MLRKKPKTLKQKPKKYTPDEIKKIIETTNMIQQEQNRSIIQKHTCG